MLNCLKSPVHTIFIMLGQKCNFNCRYCMQHGEDGLHVDLPQEINPDIYEYIEEMQKRRDINDWPLSLHFFGGEPLIYFNHIKTIVEKTKELGVRYSFISNGYAITQEMVDFFNKYDFGETISWDGSASKKTRLIDVFSIPEKKNLLFQLNRLGVSGVCSGFATPKKILNDFQKLSDEYQQIHQYPLWCNIDQLFDTGLADRELFDINYEQIFNEVKELCDNYIENKKNKPYAAETQYIEQLINMVSFYTTNKDFVDYGICHCGNGYSTINMDLSGTFYNCHNTADVLGTIYDSPDYILSQLLKYDKSLKLRDMCKTCSILPICRNGCKLVSKDIRNESYCKIKKASFEPIIQYLLTFIDKI